LTIRHDLLSGKYDLKFRGWRQRKLHAAFKPFDDQAISDIDPKARQGVTMFLGLNGHFKPSDCWTSTIVVPDGLRGKQKLDLVKARRWWWDARYSGGRMIIKSAKK
jgi:hypothetical protein